MFVFNEKKDKQDIWQGKKKKTSSTILRNTLNIKENKYTEDSNIKPEIY